MKNIDHTQSLISLGFTNLEADVYAYLLQESSVTGYRVAQALGKPTANTYKALESLERKGAVLVDESENRLCRAIPANELLNHLDHRFQENRKQAAHSLSKLGRPSADDRVYQLRSRGQVFERCRSMLANCKHVVIMDAFPDIVSELQPDIEQAALRGVEVIIKTYIATEIKDVRVVVRPRGHEIIDALPGNMISINIDGAEHLLSLVHTDSDQVYQAIWTSSAIISYLLYNGLVNEISQVAIMWEMEQDTTVEKLKKVFSDLRYLHPATSKGFAYQNLMRQLGFTLELDQGKDAPQKHSN